MNLPAVTLAICVLVSFALAGVLVLIAARHGRFTMDIPGEIQKVHFTPTPRVGGIAIYLGLLVSRSVVNGPDVGRILDTVLAAGVPALAVGLFEDITKRAGIGLRLAATIVSGFLACLIAGVSLTHLDVPMLDAMLTFGPCALAFTAIAVGGIANAINVIDGFHGLASGVTTIALLGLAAIANAAGDSALAMCAGLLAAAVAGFWLVNFPWGKLFLGDGGAYFTGFALAWLAVLLPMRNPSVSPWASLVVCAYPVIEVLYSVARRLRNHRSPGKADRSHLHSLVACHVVQRRLRRLEPTLQNAAVSVLMWFCAAIPALLGVTFYGHTPWLVLAAAGCVLLYHWLYCHLARA